tara:strand:- start:1431 stop:2393 length:963 start_codon:yes stop_codon:yes gene_type:complete
MSTECIVHQLLLDGKGGGVEVDKPEQLVMNDQHILWSHIEYGRPGAFQWLEEQGLTELEAESLTRIDTRPRIRSFNKGMLILLRAINLNPGADQEDMVSIRIWITKGRIITARQRRVASIQDMVSDLKQHNGPKTEGEFLTTLIELIMDYICNAVDEIEEDISKYEDTQDNNDKSVQHELSALRRKTAIIRRFLAPQRDALDALYRAPRSLLDDQELHYLHEQTDRIIRFVEDLDLARERTLVLQEEMRNKIAEQQNSRTYLLSIVATIFLPLGVLTGVFGMNVSGLPGTEDRLAFIYVSAGMFITALGIIFFMRWKHWL